MTHPTRTRALVLTGACAKVAASSDYPFGWTGEQVEALRAYIQWGWGTGATIRPLLAALASDPQLPAWAASVEQQGATPGAAPELLRNELADGSNPKDPSRFFQGGAGLDRRPPSSPARRRHLRVLQQCRRRRPRAEAGHGTMTAASVLTYSGMSAQILRVAQRLPNGSSQTKRHCVATLSPILGCCVLWNDTTLPANPMTVVSQNDCKGPWRDYATVDSPEPERAPLRFTVERVPRPRSRSRRGHRFERRLFRLA
jgi:hypothetical protein